MENIYSIYYHIIKEDGPSAQYHTDTDARGLWNFISQHWETVITIEAVTVRNPFSAVGLAILYDGATDELLDMDYLDYNKDHSNDRQRQPYRVCFREPQTGDRHTLYTTEFGLDTMRDDEPQDRIILTAHVYNPFDPTGYTRLYHI